MQAAPNTKIVQGLLDRPNDLDIALVRKAIWKARCVVDTIAIRWEGKMSPKAYDSLVNVAAFLTGAHVYYLEYRKDLGEIASGLGTSNERTQLNIVDCVEVVVRDRTPPDSPPVEE